MAACDYSNPCPTCLVEQWRPVVGLEDAFEVSSIGRVRRLRDSGRRKAGDVRTIKPASTTGYACITLQDSGRKVSTAVHILMMRAFIGPPPEGYEVNHISRIRHDNRLCNLEYTTHQGNVLHSIDQLRAAIVPKRGVPKPRSGARGAQSKTSRLTPAIVEEMRQLRASEPAWWTYQRLGKRFDVQPGTARRAVKGVYWRVVCADAAYQGCERLIPKSARSRDQLDALGPDDVVTAAEAAIICGVTTGAVDKWTQRGLLIPTLVGVKGPTGTPGRRFRVRDVRAASEFRYPSVS